MLSHNDLTGIGKVIIGAAVFVLVVAVVAVRLGCR
jgi:hypothetical protein